MKRLYLLSTLILLLCGNCGPAPDTARDTLIIIDPFTAMASYPASGGNGNAVSVIRSIIDRCYQHNRHSDQRIFIQYGQRDKDRVAVVLPDSLKRLGFKQYDRAYAAFRDESVRRIEQALSDNSANDQSAFVEVFGNQFLIRKGRQPIEKVLFIGNLVEKDFQNLALLKRDYRDHYNSLEIETVIREAFQELSSRFAERFKSYTEKRTNIELFVLKNGMEALVYDDPVYYDMYLQQLLSFLSVYDTDGVVNVLNEY